MTTRISELPSLPARDPDGHKGSFGRVAIVAGSEGMFGAAILAAHGALRGGAGLVVACLPREAMLSFTSAVPPALTADRDRVEAAGCAGADAIVLGPGLTNERARALAGAAAGVDAPRVFDAGGLDGATLRAFRPDIVTPHPGEAARLLETTAATVQRDRHAAAQRLVETFGGVVVLKGARTLVRDAGRVFENDTGNAGMATGGTGDVLAGLIGALLAQGMEPFDAACLAVHVHGRAGDLVASRLSEPGLVATDLPLAIAEVFGR